MEEEGREGVNHRPIPFLSDLKRNFVLVFFVFSFSLFQGPELKGPLLELLFSFMIHTGGAQ